MRISVVVSILLLSCVACADEPAFGPQVNRDDQYRFSWYLAKSAYPAYRDFGLNLVIDRYYSGWFLQDGQKRQAEIDRIVPYVREMGRDGIDFVYQMVLENKALQRDEFRALGPDGKIAKPIDMSYGPTQRQALEYVRQVALTFTNLSALVGVQGYSEVRGKPSWRPDYVAACRAANGFDPPREMREGTAAFVRARADFPLSGIVDEDYPPFRYLSWFWRSGDGWGDYTDAASEVFGRIVGRELFSFADPIIRTPPIWGSGGRHLGVGNHWLYPLPSPCDIAEAVAEVQAMARGTPGMKVFMMVQGFCYRSYTAPIGKTVENPPDWLKDERFAKISYLTQPPDVMREALWMLLMRRADGVGTYSQQHLGVAESRCTNTNTFYAMDDVFRNVATPLGPLLRALPERPPEVALLTSAASSLLTGGGASWGWGSTVGSMLVGAGLMPYVLYEEEIARDGIPPTVKVMVTESGCRAFTARTAKALRVFQDRGGILVAGSRDLAPGLLADLDMPEGLVGRYDRSTWNGRGDRLGANAVARELKAALSSAYAPYADTANEDIVLHVRSYRAGDCLFAVNDRRTFGDYIGQWKQQEDKGLPNAGTVTVARADTGAVYDLVAHRAVPFRVKDGKTEIDVRYATTDGRLFLLAPRKLGALSIRREGDEVVVTSPDADVMIPIQVKADGAKPRTGVVRDGVWRRTYPHGANLRVTNFADGSFVKSRNQ